MSSVARSDTLAARLALVTEHLRAENEHDLDAIMATFGQQPHFTLNALTLTDQSSIRQLYDGFGFGGQGSFSTLKAELVHMHVSEETIIGELVLTGTHTDTWQGIPATQQAFTIPACAIFSFDEQGMLAGERVYFDGALLLQQLGVLA